MRILLEFGQDQSAVHQARLSYAFRVFCAIFGHQPILEREDATSADVILSYSEISPKLKSAPRLRLSSLYRARSCRLPAPQPTVFERGTERTFLFYGPDAGGEPDWPAEIFEWIACADEYSCSARDAVGRVPFMHSYMGRHGLEPTTPYAAVAMSALQSKLCQLVPAAQLGAQCPTQPATHFIVNTHDVDYLALHRAGSVKRLLKNAGISLVMRRCTESASAQIMHAVRVAGGGSDPLDQLGDLAEGESKRKIGASFFFIARRQHRRDANYSIRDPRVVNTMRSVERQGMEVGIHGSYTSFDSGDRLRQEFETLRTLGFDPRGHRAHWLRFTLDRLVDDMETTGALYDSSLGWSDTIGFRAGACFAFPPYNFQQERPARFLELPLVGMDQSLCGTIGRERLACALRASRKYGWGGISLLWHPSAFGGGQFRKDVGDLFWQLVGSNPDSDSWVSGLEFVKRVQRRYREVGLLGD